MRSRTSNLLIRSQMLYPIELRLRSRFGTRRKAHGWRYGNFFYRRSSETLSRGGNVPFSVSAESVAATITQGKAQCHPPGNGLMQPSRTTVSLRTESFNFPLPFPVFERKWAEMDSNHRRRKPADLQFVNADLRGFAQVVIRAGKLMNTGFAGDLIFHGFALKSALFTADRRKRP